MDWTIALSNEIHCRIRLAPALLVEYLSPNAERIFGYTVSELTDFQTFSRCLIHPEDRNIFNQLFLGIPLASPQRVRFICRNRSIIWLEMNFRIVSAENGQPEALEFCVRDINPQVKTESSLNHTVEALEQMIRSNPAPIAITNIAEGTILEVNQQMIKFLGCDRDKLIGAKSEDFGMQIPSTGSREDWLDPLLEKGWMHTSDRTILLSNGEQRHAVAFYQLIEFRGATSIINMLIDSSAQHNFHEQMEKAAQISRTLSESLTLSDIYERLGEATRDLLPDISTIFISSFDPQMKEIRCKYAYQDGIKLDTNEFPVMPLEPPGRGTQSEAIRTRQTIIINDLPSRLKKVSKQFHKRGANDNQQTQSAILSPLVASGEVLGVLQVQSYTLNRFSEDDARLMTLVGNTAAVAIQNALLFEGLTHTTSEITQAYEDTLDGWARALELRDRETEGHTRRVTDLTVRLARALEVPTQDLQHIRRGALLHDIGKMGIPDHILLKPGPLTEEEWGIMRKHPYFAFKILSTISHLRLALSIPYCHHERWDGGGYPQGLKEKLIPLWARIFALADVYDALISDRPYRPAWPVSRALDYISSQSGKHFDPEIVPVFLDMIRNSPDWMI